MNFGNCLDLFVFTSISGMFWEQGQVSWMVHTIYFNVVPFFIQCFGRDSLRSACVFVAKMGNLHDAGGEALARADEISFLQGL